MTACMIDTLIAVERLAQIASGLEALRGAHVEPMALSVNVGQDSRLAWGWYKFKALPGHPSPRNAGRGYSHPTRLSAFDAAANPRGAAPLLSVAQAGALSDDEIWYAVRNPILEACGLDASGWEQHVMRGQDGEVRAIDITRGGIDPWATYPSAGLTPEVETAEGYDKPVLHWGGATEKNRVRRVLRAEEQSTDAYMASLL